MVIKIKNIEIKNSKKVAAQLLVERQILVRSQTTAVIRFWPEKLCVARHKAIKRMRLQPQDTNYKSRKEMIQPEGFPT